jgi:doxX subfamily
MCVAFFVANGGSIAEGELAFVYLLVFVLLFFAGPGRFSVDGWLAKKLA